jgi:hypothetical protein
MAKKKAPKPVEYTLPERAKLKPSTKRVLALDPGSKNMAISVVAVNDQNKVRVIANSLLKHPIYDLTRFGAQRKAFLSEIAEWVDLYQPNGIVIERFVSRGLHGSLGEYVSSMIGLIGGRYPDLPLLPLMAASWKNAFNRRHPVQLDELYPQCRTTPHQLDSSFIGIYGLEKGLRRTVEYDPVDVMLEVEDSSLLRLINRKKRP